MKAPRDPWSRLAAAGLAFVACTMAAPAQDRAHPAVLAGQGALEDGFYDVAATNFLAALDETSRRRDRAELGLLLMDAWHRAEKFDAMLAWMDDHERETRIDETEAAYVLWRARALYGVGRPAEALEALTFFDRLARDVPRVDEAVRLRGQVLAALGRHEAALEAFRMYDRYYSDRPDAPANLYDWAGCLAEAGDPVAERERLENLVARFPDAPEASLAVWRLMRQAVEAGEPAVAERQAGILLATNRTVDPGLAADAWQVRAWVEEEQGRVTNALAALRQSVRLSPDPDVRQTRILDQSRLLLDMKEPDQALVLIEAEVQDTLDTPAAAALQHALAGQLLRAGYLARALDAYQQFLEAFPAAPQVPGALLGRARCLAGLERWAEAALAAEKAAAHEQAGANILAEAQALIGTARAAEGNFAAAVSAFDEALAHEEDPAARADLLARRARAHEGLGDLAAAEADYRAMDGRDATSLPGGHPLLLAAAMYERGEAWDQALALYRELLDADPDTPWRPQALLRRGRLLERRGEPALAEQDFDAVMAGYAESEWAEQAAVARMQALYREGRIDEVIAATEAFRTRHPASALHVDVDLLRAQLAFNRGLFEEAETRFLAVAEQYENHPRAPDALYWAGRAAAEQQEFRRAVETYNRLIRRYPGADLIAEARFAQGDALSEFGEFAGAVLAYDEAARTWPDRPLAVQAILRKADCQFALGADRPERYLEASVTYRQVLDRDDAQPADRFQAEVKLGRTLEKLGRTDEALEAYLQVVYRWLALTEQGEPLADVWFVRAAFHAAALEEAAGRNDRAIDLYRRVAEAGVSAAAEAERRLTALGGAAMPAEDMP